MSAARWSAGSEFPFHWHRWEETYLVYHPGSGSTHVLDLLGAEVLQRLEKQPANLAELAEYLCREGDLDPDDELYEYIERAVNEFERLGLIEQNLA